MQEQWKLEQVFVENAALIDKVSELLSVIPAVEGVKKVSWEDVKNRFELRASRIEVFAALKVQSVRTEYEAEARDVFTYVLKENIPSGQTLGRETDGERKISDLGRQVRLVRAELNRSV